MDEIFGLLKTIFAKEAPSIKVVIGNYQEFKNDRQEDNFDEKVDDLCKKLDEKIGELEELAKENPKEAENMTIPDDILTDIKEQFQEYLGEWGKNRKKRVYMGGVVLYCSDEMELGEETQNLIEQMMYNEASWTTEIEQEYQDKISDFVYEHAKNDLRVMTSTTSATFYFGYPKQPCDDAIIRVLIDALNQLINPDFTMFDSYSIIYV